MRDEMKIEFAPLVAMLPGGKETLAIYAISSVFHEKGFSMSGTLYSIVESLLRRFNKKMICPEEISSLVEEVRKHQWIEAEKAKKDIWSERDPKNPFRAALIDWHSKHYSSWNEYLKNREGEMA